MSCSTRFLSSTIMRTCLVALIALCGPFSSHGQETAAGGLAVDAAYPGGNIILEKVEGDTVSIHQDLRDTKGDWFYWNFRVRGAAGRTLTFKFTKGNVIGVRGPAISLDAGRSWSWLGTNAVEGASFHYAFPAQATETRFAFAIPYLESDLKAFLKHHENSPALKVETLCKTAKGREVELVRVGRVEGGSAHRILLTARHHACESLASYAIEGILESALADDEVGRWFRSEVEILAVPFMDKDGVEEGDQGKNRKPHDHNRDYDEGSLYASVKALKERVPAWSQGKLRLALDIHCPWIRGGENESIYFVGSQNQENWEQASRFAGVLESVRTGPLPYRVSDNLPYGKAWNTGANFKEGKSCSRWASELAGIRFASSVEVPYANASGQEVNAESVRAFGRDLARAIRKFLE